MKQRYENDDRIYSRFKPSPRSRFFVRCLSEQPHADGPPWLCRFTQREDDFRMNLRKKITHKCQFMPQLGLHGGQRRLEDVAPKAKSRNVPLLRDLARFLAKANVSTQAVCDR